MDEEEYHLQSKFYYPEDLETSEAGISESQEAMDDFVNKQKSENRKRRRPDWYEHSTPFYWS